MKQGVKRKGIVERLFRRQRPRLKCFQEEYIRREGNLYPLDLGVGEVPLARIVGTAARCQDAQGGFQWRRRRERATFGQMKRRLQRGEAIPPVRLYKLGSELYVREGHAQVEAVRALGREQIMAQVIEYMAPSDTLQGILLQEQGEFERQTGLTTVRTSLPGRYAGLFRQIKEHQRYLEQVRGHLFLFPEAVADWWQNVYSPVVSGLQGDGVLANLPWLTPADIYSYLTEHLEKEATALQIPLSKAIADLLSETRVDWQSKIEAIVPPCLFRGKCPYS